MKTMHTLLFLAAFCVGNTSFGQTDKIREKDSVEVAFERDQLMSALGQLRDSITNSIITLDSKEADASSKAKQSIHKAVKELTLYRDRVKRDLDEVEITSRKGWDANAVERIRINMQDVRREYKRIRGEAKAFLGTKS